MQVLSVSLPSHNPRLRTSCIWHKVVDFMSTCPHSNLGMEKDGKWYNLKVYHITFTHILIPGKKKSHFVSFSFKGDSKWSLIFVAIRPATQFMKERRRHMLKNCNSSHTECMFQLEFQSSELTITINYGGYRMWWVFLGFPL